MRRLHPPPDLSAALGHDSLTDEPAAAGGLAELTDEELLHGYAYPADRTWLRANMVGSLDGIAAVDGVSAGLSGAVDKRVFSLLRVLADVVVVGAGTVRTEGYRGARVVERFRALRASLDQPPAATVAIVSRSLDLDPWAAVFTDTSVRPLVITCEAAPSEQRRALERVADVVVTGESQVDLTQAVDALRARGLRRMLCEGGPSLLHDLLAADLVDELCLTLAPALVGGDERHVLRGPTLDPVRRVRLAGILEQDGVLLTRYLLDAPAKGA